VIDVVSGPAAAANVAAEACNLILYGPPGSQKTTDAVRAFTRPDGSCSAFFISCEDGALKPILARGLPVPDHPRAPVKSWEAMVEAVSYAGAHRNKYSAVIIDTVSTWTANVHREVDARGGKNKFAVWNTMRDMLYHLREGGRALGLHVVMIAHAMPPIYDESGAYKGPGGPLLVPKTAIDLFHGVIDTMLRVGTIQTVGQAPTRVYFTGGQEWPTGAGLPPADAGLWRVKNREGCGLMCVPADLGSFLRSRRPAYAGL
jgi:hypothetical protein